MKRGKSTIFYVQLLLTLLVCAFLIVPVIQSVLAGLTDNYLVGVGSGFTLRWFGKVWDLYRDTIFRSILIGLACLFTTLLLGVPAAYAMVKRQNRWTRMFEEFLVTPLAIPGLAIALALIINYGRFTEFRTSSAFILVGHVIFTLPFYDAFRHSHFELYQLERIRRRSRQFKCRFLAALFSNCRSKCHAWNLGGIFDGIHSFHRGI